MSLSRGIFHFEKNNDYKSIVCQEVLYLLELTRYIHLNPLRAGLVPDLEAEMRLAAAVKKADD